MQLDDPIRNARYVPGSRRTSTTLCFPGPRRNPSLGEEPLNLGLRNAYHATDPHDPKQAARDNPLDVTARDAPLISEILHAGLLPGYGDLLIIVAHRSPQ